MAGDALLSPPAPFDLSEELVIEESLLKEALNHLVEALSIPLYGFQQTSSPLGDGDRGRAA